VTDLAIRSLVKRYDSVIAVNDASLEARNGELISLLGPSGCGKTTTLRVVAGFERPDSGAILFDGKDVSGLLPERRDIGMVFQNYALFPHMTVLENCLFGLQMRGVPRATAMERIGRSLDLVQLTGREGRYPRELSGGQQQRVALARALVIEPAILLLDEPLANLDAVLRDEMRFLIRSIQQQVGITTLYVTHDQAEALLISDRVAVMFDGKVAQEGTPKDIYHKPRSRRAASFVGLSNFLDGKVAQVSGESASLETAFGKIAAQHDGSVKAGETRTLMIRPEAIDLAATVAQADANLLQGIVSESFFLGSVTDYRIRMTDGSVVQVHARPGIHFANGDAVTLSFPSAAAWMLPEVA
jgi:putative spermidine/putrescine transport system ATP-binding protein